MITKYLVIALGLLATTALAQTGAPSSPTPPATAFEAGGRIETKMFIPEDLMKGPLHTVGEQAENDGLVNTYFLYSGDNASAVTTGIALRTRIREIYAIDKLEGMSKTDEFTKAIKESGKEKVDSVVALAKDPVGTIKRVPQGASRFFGRIGESLKGGKSEGESNMWDSIAGVDKAKTALAVKLGVSPYSTNQELQELLTSTARAMAGGGLVIGAALMPIGGGLGTVITGLNVNEALQQTLVNSPPSELRMINRKKLMALGMTHESADEFLMHPWYSPWQETIVVDALNTIGVNPTAFLERACRALTEQDAIYFQRLAQVLARYHTAKTPLKSIRLGNGAVCALDAKGVLVIPLSCDYAIWSERAAGRVGDFANFAQAHREIKGLALWVDGKVSDTATRELKNRKIDLATGVLDQH